MFRIFILYSLVASTSAISCYSCSNCDDSQELATCGTEDIYCLTFKMYFFDYVTHKGCAPECSEEKIDHIFHISCCTESGCNGTNGIFSNSNIVNLIFTALFTQLYFVTQLF